jgi:predicted cation transporter
VNPPTAVIVLLALLLGPLLVAAIEHNFEAYCFAAGLAAVTVSQTWGGALVFHAATEPLMITGAVIAASLIFGRIRDRLDQAFAGMRKRTSRAALTTIAVAAIALLSSLITAIVAALLLVEAVRLLRLAPTQKITVTVLGCFAIGMGAALTPIGEPLATLVATGLNLGFTGLFDLLMPLVVPAVVVLSLAAGWVARGAYVEESNEAGASTAQSPLAAVIQGVKVYVFVAGLVLVSHAYAPLADHYVPLVGTNALYWINMLSAALDNATLVAVEMHHMPLERARELLMSLLISGGMLIPGNIPNIVSAGALRIGSLNWARRGIPIGLVLLGIYFAAFRLIN